MQNYTQLSITEAGISVISRGDIYALLHILGSAERGITCTPTRMLNLKTKVWLKLGDSSNGKNFCAKDCKNMRVLENASECFPFPFPPKNYTLYSWLLS